MLLIFHHSIWENSHSISNVCVTSDFPTLFDTSQVTIFPLRDLSTSLSTILSECSPATMLPSRNHLRESCAGGGLAWAAHAYSASSPSLRGSREGVRSTCGAYSTRRRIESDLNDKILKFFHGGRKRCGAVLVFFLSFFLWGGEATGDHFPCSNFDC